MSDTYSFDSFGSNVSISGVTPNVYLYRGEQIDTDVGMYYLRARWFRATQGVFLTADKWEPSTRELFRFSASHLYVYAGANPVQNVDPSGQRFIDKALRLAYLIANPLPRWEAALLATENASIIQQVRVAGQVTAEIFCRTYSLLNLAAWVGLREFPLRPIPRIPDIFGLPVPQPPDQPLLPDMPAPAVLPCLVVPRLPIPQ